MMNENSEISEKLRAKIPRIRNSVNYNSLSFTIPRRLNFSGHFHLKTPHFHGGRLRVAMRN